MSETSFGIIALYRSTRPGKGAHSHVLLVLARLKQMYWLLEFFISKSDNRIGILSGVSCLQCGNVDVTE